MYAIPFYLQRVCQDRVFPLIHFFAKGGGRSGTEPIRGYFLTLFIAIACIAIGESHIPWGLVQDYRLLFRGGESDMAQYFSSICYVHLRRNSWEGESCAPHPLNFCIMLVPPPPTPWAPPPSLAVHVHHAVHMLHGILLSL